MNKDAKIYVVCQLGSACVRSLQVICRNATQQLMFMQLGCLNPYKDFCPEKKPGLAQKPHAWPISTFASKQTMHGDNARC